MGTHWAESAPTAGDDGVAAGKRSLPAPFTTSHLLAEATPPLGEGVLLPGAFHAAVLHALLPTVRARAAETRCLKTGGKHRTQLAETRSKPRTTILVV